MNYNQTLLRELMDKNEYNVSEAAKALDMLQPNLSKVKSGDKRFTNEQLIKIAELLGVRPEIVLIKANLDKAKTLKERDAWVKLLTSTAATWIVTTMTIKTNITDCVQCIFIKKMIDRSLVNMR